MSKKVEVINETVQLAIAQDAKIFNEGIVRNMQLFAYSVAEHAAKFKNYGKLLCKHIPSISQEMYDAFLAIGEGRLDIRCLTYNCPASKLIATLPAKYQKEIYDLGEVPVMDKDGKVAYKPIAELSRQEAKTAIKESGLRPLREQQARTPAKPTAASGHGVDSYVGDRAWASALFAKPTAASGQSKNKVRYLILDDGLVEFKCPCTFTPAQLEEILSLAKQKQLESLTKKK